jgi:hypothetical protein
MQLSTDILADNFTKSSLIGSMDILVIRLDYKLSSAPIPTSSMSLTHLALCPLLLDLL